MLQFGMNRTADLPSAQPGFSYIYVLVDPRNSEIRYVGRTNKPKLRLWQHSTYSRDERTHKGAWVRELRKAGVRPEMRVVDTVADADAPDREKWWQASLLSAGVRLTNHAEAVEGGVVVVIRSEEWRAKNAAFLATLNKRPEIRAMKSKNTSLRWQDPEFRERMVTIRRGQSRREFQKSSRIYRGFIDPDGNPVGPITHLPKFCAERGLNKARMYMLVYPNSESKRYQGWTYDHTYDNAPDVESPSVNN